MTLQETGKQSQFYITPDFLLTGAVCSIQTIQTVGPALSYVINLIRQISQRGKSQESKQFCSKKSGNVWTLEYSTY